MLGKRLPIRVRAALAAALTAAVAFTVGAWWLRHEVYASKMDDALNRARASLDVIEQRYNRGTESGKALFQSPDTWVIVGPAGRFVEGDPDLQPFVPRPLGVHPDLPGPTVPIERDLRLGAVTGDARPGSEQLAGRDIRVVSSAFRGRGLLDGRSNAPVENLTLHILVTPRDAEEAVTTNDTLDRLEQAAERQRRFTADASHELRTPLASLRADLEVALHYPDQTNWPDVIRGTLSDAERLEQLTEDLLLLADLDNRTPRAAHPVELGSLAR